MTPRTLATALALLLAGTAASTTVSAHERVPSGQQVGTSPWGPKDEIGRLNLITGPRARRSCRGSAAARPMTWPPSTTSACPAGRMPATRTTSSG